MSDRMEARRELRRHESEAEGISEPAQTVSYAPKTHESQMDLLRETAEILRLLHLLTMKVLSEEREQSSKKEKKKQRAEIYER